MEEETVWKKYDYGIHGPGNNLRGLGNNTIQIVRKKAGPDLVAEWTFVML